MQGERDPQIIEGGTQPLGFSTHVELPSDKLPKNSPRGLLLGLGVRLLRYL